MRSILNLKSAMITMCLSVAAAGYVSASAFSDHDNSKPISGSSAYSYKPGQNILAEELSARFNVDVTLEDDQLVIVGARANIENLINTVNDIEALSALYMPVSQSDVSVRMLNQPCGTWAECAEAIGIAREVSLFKIDSARDDGTCVYFQTDTDANRDIANVYINAVKRTLNKLHWFGKRAGNGAHESYVDGLFGSTDREVYFDYSIINQFLGKILLTEVESGGGSADDSIKATIPQQQVLKHIIAASRGDAHLVETDEPGVFDVHTTSLGEGLGTTSDLILELVLDCSTSMDGNPIETLNEKAPELLRLVQGKLPSGAKIQVNIIPFSHQLVHIRTFTLTPQSPISWTPLKAAGRTNLRLIEERVCNNSGAQKLLIGFTDGENTNADGKGEPLTKDNVAVRKYVEQNKFAYTTIQYVGTQSINSIGYLEELARATGGIFGTSSDMSAFFESITAKIDELLEPKKDFVFKFGNAALKVIWQPTSRAGVFATGERVEAGDTINSVVVRGAFESSARQIGSGSSNERTGEAALLAEIARLQAELGKLKG